MKPNITRPGPSVLFVLWGLASSLSWPPPSSLPSLLSHGPTTSGAMSYLLAPHHPRLRFDTSAIRPLLQFGRWIFLTNLIAVTGSSMLQLVISRQLGAAELGLYFLAAKLAFI